jgi:hypothetical protein
MCLGAQSLSATTVQRRQPGEAANQVRTGDFDFEVLETEHFDIYFYEDEAELTRVAARMAERWYARLSRILAHQLRGRQPVVLYASRPDFQQTTTVDGLRGETVRGVAEASKRRVILPFAGPLAETDEVLGHEMVHAFQFDMTQQTATSPTRDDLPRAFRMPLWFIEGMAVYLTVGPSDPITSMWVRDAAIDDRFPTLGELNDNRGFAFRFGHALWAYITGRFGDDVIARILNVAARGSTADDAIRSVLLIPVDSLVTEWQDAVRFAFAEWVEQAHESGQVSDPTETGSRLNLAPALSPDGGQLVYISDIGGGSVDMFLKDAGAQGTGRRLTTVASNPRFEYIQFISAAGEWSPAGNRFAYGQSVGTTAKLMVRKVGDDGEDFERAFPGVGEIFDPTWSPDGRQVAFSGLVGGQSDLFVYDTVLDSLRRLTNDLYADILPAWSPDGASVAFTTDRFTSEPSALRYGSYRLGLINPASGEIREALHVEGMNHVNPQWSPDGGSVYFIGDRGGVTNVYRLDLGGRRFYQVTQEFTGVAGITGLSPALSSARNVDMIAYSVFEHGAYQIRMLEGKEALRGRQLQPN